MTKEFEISIPKDLGGISLRQYQQYLKMHDRWDKEDEVYFKTKVLQIFCGLNIDDTYKIPIVKFNSVIEHVLECFKEETPLVKKFTMTGKNKAGDDTKVEFGFIPKLDDMSFGEYIDVDTNIGDWDNMYRVMSVLYRPIKQKSGEKYLIEEYKGDLYHDAMRHTPMDAVISSLVFFYNLGKELSMAMIDFLETEKEVDSMQLQTSMSDTVGIIQFKHLLSSMSSK